MRTPDRSPLEGVVSSRVLGANGYPRATSDVDFLVGDEAFEHHAGGIVTKRVAVQVNGVAVDCLSIAADEGISSRPCLPRRDSSPRRRCSST